MTTDVFQRPARYLLVILLGGPLWACSAGTAFGPSGVEGSQSAVANGSDAIAVVTDNQATTDTPVDFGPNVFIFDPNMSDATIQTKLDSTYTQQASNQFGSQRIAYLFKPGSYNVDVQIGFYMTASGLGLAPDDVDIKGAVRSKASWFNGNATQNFWRGAENMAVTPTQDNGVNIWAVSQATAFRRMHVKGKMALSDNGYSSGGFIADTRIDTSIDSGTQQQFLTRNSELTSWTGGSWNMVFIGDTQAPPGAWPAAPYSSVDTTPSVREKPYLTIDDNGEYAVIIPSLKQQTKGTSWNTGTDPNGVTSLSINHFYIAHAQTDTADSINSALQKGLNLILTPGVYKTDSALKITRANTIVLGLGLATVAPQKGNAAITVDDVDGVSIAGILVDAGAQQSDALMVIGPASASDRHQSNPTVLFDVACRVGGAGAGSAKSCLTINSDDVILDNIWLWRADHGNGVGWTTNPSDNGITVNGDSVTAFGLFVEHFERYQTLWNGNNGKVYFYQSEIPYDVPDQGAWTHDGANGYASYKVADSVTSHEALGVGVYCVFTNSVVLDNAIETPSNSGVTMAHLLTEWLGQADGSAINHIINGSQAAVNSGNRQAKTDN